MDLNMLLQFLSTHMGGGSANNPFASLLSLLRGGGQGVNVNALSGGPSGASGPPSLQSLFGSMLGGGPGSAPQADPAHTMPSMGHPQGGFPMNALGSGLFGALGSGTQGGFAMNPRMQYFGSGAGGIYPSQGQG